MISSATQSRSAALRVLRGVPLGSTGAAGRWNGWRTQDFELISRPGVLDAHVALLGQYTTNREL